MIGEILLHIGKNLANECGLFQKHLGAFWDGGSSTTPRKCCNFYPHLSMETVLPALKLSQNSHIRNIDSDFCTHHIYPS